MPDRAPATDHPSGALDRVVWSTFWGLLLLGTIGGAAVLAMQLARAWPIEGWGLATMVGATAFLLFSLPFLGRKLLRGPSRAFLFRTGAVAVDTAFGVLMELVLLAVFCFGARALWNLLL